MFRLATANDWEAVYRLVCALEETHFPAERFREIFLRQVESPLYACCLWEENGTVAAMLNLRMDEQLHHCDRVAEILEFAVDPACRGGGVGHQLLGYALAFCREAGCCLAELSCGMRRKDAHRFYAREGFADTHRRFTMGL